MFFILLTLICDLYSAPIDTSTAIIVAKNVYWRYLKNKESNNYSSITPQLIFTKKVKSEVVYYVINMIINNKNKGFIIVAADNHVYPILSIGYEGEYKSDTLLLPPNYKSWMDNYTEQILYVKEHNIKSTAYIDHNWQELLNPTNIPNNFNNLEPLLTTTWGQECYYNQLCPYNIFSPYCERTLTGCVATAMAQIMKYHNYPINGNGYHGYNAPTYGYQYADFGSTTYDWQNMPDNITSQNSAIATLMYHCGVSVDMDYSIYESTTGVENAKNSLINYFNYSSKAKYIHKENFEAQWKNIIISQLNSHLPIYYSGQGSGQGSIRHAFVCDGYLDSNQFHFNWGWGYYDPNYYYLDNLNPDENNFTIYQVAIIDIIPLNIISPNGSENYIPGTSQNIIWNINNNIQNIKIEITTDNGENWSTIISSYPASSGSYPWTIPNINSSQCKIRISNVLFPDMNDVSDNNFNISNSTLNLGLIAYYPLESNANDYSGNDFNGSLENPPTFEPGVVGNGVRILGDGFIYGNGKCVLLPGSLATDLNSRNSFSISLWVKDEGMTHFHGESYISFGNAPLGWVAIGHYVDQDNNNQILGFSIKGGPENNDQFAIKIPFDNNYTSHFIHYTMTYNNGLVKAYINGIYVGQENQIADIQTTTAGLGRHWWWQDNTTYWSTRLNGIIDEVRIYNRSLSDSEIQQLYNQVPNLTLSSPNGGENYIPATIQNITWSSGGVQNIKIELSTDNGSSWSIITLSYPASYGSYPWTVPNYNSPNCKIRISDVLNPASNDMSGNVFIISSSSLNLGLVAYYPFNGNANDESGNGYNGTVNGASLTTDVFGNANNAYYFNGTNNLIDIPNFDLNTETELTVRVLAKPDNLVTGKSLFYHGFNGQIQFIFYNNTIHFDIMLSDANWYDATFDLSHVRWYDLVGEWKKGDSLKLYIDGVQKDAIPVPNLYLINPGSNYNASIGAYARNQNGSPTFFKGVIDEVRIYNRILSQSEIQQLYIWIPHLTLNSPNGGENYIPGTVQNITWNNNGVQNIKIELTTNNGISWSTISSSYPAASGSYPWTIPNYNSATCKIQISDVLNPASNDMSGDVFIISSSSLNLGLVAYYPFNGNANDESGNGYNGTVNGASLTTDIFGNANNAYYFDGVNDFISIPDFNLTTDSAVTVRILARPDDLSSSKMLFYHGKNGLIELTMMSNIVRFAMKFTDGNWYGINGVISEMKWYDIAGVWKKGESMKLYIDGVQQNAVDVPNFYLISPDWLHASVGVYDRGSDPALYHKGKADELRVYNRALSQSELNNIPLPVEFASFTANINIRDVSLSWRTLKEINNKGFEIERKKTDEEWSRVGYLEGKGTTNTETSYKFDDKKLNTGKYNYRIKQVDYNGNFEYHTLNMLIEVGLPTKFDLSQNYPNPFNPNTKIDFELPVDCRVTLKVYDITGREIASLLNNEFKSADYYTIRFDASNFASGIYFYRLQTEKFMNVKRMVLIK